MNAGDSAVAVIGKWCRFVAEVKKGSEESDGGWACEGTITWSKAG